MMQEVNIPIARIPKVGLPIVGWEREDVKVPHPGYEFPAYELSCEQSEFVKNTAYTVRVMETQAASEQMQVEVVCVGGTVTPSSFSTDSPQNLKVTPTEDTCIVTLVCNGREVGRFEMREVLTVPEYIFGSSETEFEIGTEYELTVARVTAPIKQTQIEVACTGGLVSPQFLVDEGTPFAFDGPNSKVLVTPTEERCVVTLKVNLAGVVYSVGKFTMKAEEHAVDYLVSTITIDQNISDPETMITGDVNGEAIQAIRNNSHIYLCKYLGEKDGEGQMAICQLDDNDRNFYHDGTPAVLTGAEGDVMMRRARLWTKAVEREPDVWDISFAYGDRPEKAWKDFGSNNLIGVYKTRKSDYSNNKKINSINSPDGYATRISYKEFKSYCSQRGKGYRLINWKDHCSLAFLSIATYGTTNVGDIIQADFFMGLYKPFYDRCEWLDDVFTDGSGNMFEEQENGENRLIAISPGTDGYILKLKICDDIDCISTLSGGSSTTGYCDYFVDNNVIKNANFARSGNDNEAAGPFYYASYNGISQYFSTRMCFTGTLIEYTDVEAFKALPIIN